MPRSPILLLLLAAIAAGGPASGQRPAANSRCAQADSAAIVAARGRYHHGLYALAFAPAVLAADPLLWCDASRAELRLRRSQASLHGTVGVGWSHDRSFPARGAVIELAYGGAYAEMRREEYDIDAGVHLTDARAGVLVRPARSVAGALLLGYRDVRGAPEGWTESGVELSAPIMATLCRRDRSCWIRWEPTYLVTSRRADFSPRLQAAFPLGPTPIVAGILIELKGTRSSDPAVASVSLGVHP